MRADKLLEERLECLAARIDVLEKDMDYFSSILVLMTESIEKLEDSTITKSSLYQFIAERKEKLKNTKSGIDQLNSLGISIFKEGGDKCQST